jgi:tetratricopeptide (TPR) repeat protein
LYLKGQFEESRSQYREAIRLDLFNAFAQISLGNSFLSQGKFNEAMPIFQKRLDQDPEDYKALVGRAVCHRGQGRIAMARVDMEHAIDLARGDPDPLNTLAWWLATDLNMGDCDPKRAVRLATRAVGLSAKPTNWNTLGVAHYRAGDWKAAIEALTKSIELGRGGDGFDWFFLAMAHWQLGERAHAMTWYGKAVRWMDKNQPKNEELIRFRAEAAALLGVNPKK